MPLYEYLCLDCGSTSEVLQVSSEDRPVCRSCGSDTLQKLLSAHVPLAGGRRLPGAGDTACCGQSPGHGGCAGPGSCCGGRGH
jgi:putative FmdB family regulatory protein